MAAPNVITTGHDPNTGASVFIDSPEYKTISPHVGVIYSSDEAVLDLNKNADLEAFKARDHAGLIPKEGAVVLVAEWPPSTNSSEKIHRTLSVDIGVMLQGEIECHLDSGESRTVKHGDVLVQRGTKHYWINPSSTTAARMLCYCMPSKPVDGAAA
ncbi:hypothetical protein DV736_g2407, partial [Chaetothyriales sp. CBS 134916]